MTEFQENYFSHQRLDSPRRYPKKLTKSRKDLQHFERQQLATMQNVTELKAQNSKLKKQLKQCQAKRALITKQCCENQKKLEQAAQKNRQLIKRLHDSKSDKEGDRYRVDELKFLNKQLTSEVQELREQNQDINEKLRYCNDVLERKYHQMEQKTFKRIEQAMKRTKKAIHYLETLSMKDIEKTKDILIEHLRKANDLLRGKYCDDNANTDHEINELMNPLKNIQEELTAKSKEVTALKNQNIKLKEEVKKHKKIEKQLLPQYKDAIQKLKKNLGQVRCQLSENQYEKSQLRKSYEEKLKSIEFKYNQLFTEYRKNKLQKHIFENKLEELQNQAEEEKQRLIGQNAILRKLYKKDSTTNAAVKDSVDYGPLYQPIDDSYDQSLQDRHTIDNNFYDRRATSKVTKPTISDQTREKRPVSKKRQIPFRKHNKASHNSRHSDTLYVTSKTPNHQKYQPNDSQQYSDHQVYNNSDPNEQYGYQFVEPDSQLDGATKYYQQGSMLSQDNLKDQIFKIDQEIIEIQKNLTQQLEVYK